MAVYICPMLEGNRTVLLNLLVTLFCLVLLDKVFALWSLWTSFSLAHDSACTPGLRPRPLDNFSAAPSLPSLYQVITTLTPSCTTKREACCSFGSRALIIEWKDCVVLCLYSTPLLQKDWVRETLVSQKK